MRFSQLYTLSASRFVRRPFSLLAARRLSQFIGGFTGVLRGATSSFFGYLGYDEVCCVAGEAINPSVSVPRAVMLTIMGAAVLYVMATSALTGMQPYLEISDSSGFPDAFHYNEATWAAQIAGEDGQELKQ